MNDSVGITCANREPRRQDITSVNIACVVGLHCHENLSVIDLSFLGEDRKSVSDSVLEFLLWLAKDLLCFVANVTNNGFSDCFLFFG